MQGKTRGGDFAVVFKAYSRSNKEQESVGATLNASFSGIVAKGSVDVKAKTEIDRLVQDNSLSFEVLVEGASGTIPTTAEEMLRYAASYTCHFDSSVRPARNCPADESGNEPARVIRYTLGSYDFLGAQMTGGRSFGSADSILILSIYQRIADLRYAAAHESQFAPIPEGAAIGEADKLQLELAQFSDSAQACKKDSCKITPSLESIANFGTYLKRAETFSIDPTVSSYQDTGILNTGAEQKVFKIRGAFLYAAGNPVSRCTPEQCNGFRVQIHLADGSSDERFYRGGMCRLPSNTQVVVALGPPSATLQEIAQRGPDAAGAPELIAFVPQPGTIVSDWPCGMSR